MGCILIVAWLAFGVAAKVLHDDKHGEQELADATAVVRAAGYEPTQVWSVWSLTCGRGSRGYRWRAKDMIGHVCMGFVTQVVVDQHLHPGEKPDF